MQSSGGTKRRRPSNRHVKTSKALSWVLRHGAPTMGLDMGTDGYVPLDQLLQNSHPRLRDLTEESIREVVATNDKQRFSLRQRDGGFWYIRANQGHSIDSIDPYQLLTPINPEDLGSITVIHGTYSEPWSRHISTEGLSKMGRTHIHFAKGMPSEQGVISGMRKSCDIYIHVDGAKCAKNGVEFFESSNGVILTAGVDNKGILPPLYFSCVVARSGEILFGNENSDTSVA